MLAATIISQNLNEARTKINNVLRYQVDAIELRLDFHASINLDEIKALKNETKAPFIFTLRSKAQGGFFKDDEAKRLQLIAQLATIEPEYLDLEYDMPDDFVKKIHQQHPKINLICSYHDFQATPVDLDALLTSMLRKEFSIYKIATKANSSLDTLRMLNFVQTKSTQIKICGICMGEFGVPTRILAPIINSAINYTYLEDDSQAALGQLSLKTLLEDYNYKSLNNQTAIYALLGNSVGRSVSHIFHNQKFKKTQQNAIYLKILLHTNELSNFFILIKSLPFKGFSITMPLKEKVIPYLDELSEAAKKIQAVNTLKLQDGKWLGDNTDCIGALNCIEAKTLVINKTMVIIGAGGTAKAIAYEAKKRGAKVIILNRNRERAQNVAKQIGCEGFGLEKISEIQQNGYDILVNATPLGMVGHPQTLPIPKDKILPNITVLDMINTEIDTPLIIAARTLNCTCINGRSAFIEQAIAQHRIWFG